MGASLCNPEFGGSVGEHRFGFCSVLEASLTVKTGPLISHSTQDRLILLEECFGRLDVRDLLVSANCVGARFSVSSCPVARFVGSGALVLSAYGVVEWTDRSDPSTPVVRWWSMTKAVRHFVRNFDLRAYPELDWRRGRG